MSEPKVRNFPNFIEAFMEYTKDVPANPKYLRWACLSVIAGALERKTWMRYNGDHCYPNIYVMLVGPAGLARKSMSASKAVDLLKEIPELRFLPDHINQASAISAIYNAGLDRPLKLGDKLYTNSSCYLYSSEAVTTIRNKFGSMVELLTDLYDCGPNGWHADRAWEKATLAEGTLKIRNPCLNMLACTTPEWLTRIIGPDEIRGGFYSRVFFILQQGKVERQNRWVDDADLSGMRSMRDKLIEDLTQISHLTGTMNPDAEVREAMNTFMDENDKFIAANEKDQFISYYARKPWHILKLMQILAAADGNTKEVKLKHLVTAKEWLEEVQDDMRQVFGSVVMNSQNDMLERMWDELRHWPNAFGYSELIKKFHFLMKQREIEEVMAALIAMGRVKIVKDSRPIQFQTRKRMKIS